MATGFEAHFGELRFDFTSLGHVKLRLSHLELGKPGLNAIDVGEIFALPALHFGELTLDFESLIFRHVTLNV